MENNDSCGSDDLPLRNLKDSMPIIVLYLTCIINTSIVKEVLSTSRKHFIVAPIIKSGNVSEPCNYRPISLFPILSKTTKRI